MIKIQVLGQGMIPRDLGLAPRMEPFYADKMLIYTILETPGLKVNYLHPENGKFLPLTRQNMKIVLDKFKNATYPLPGATKPDTTKPHTPEVKTVEPPKQEITPPAPQTPPVEPPKPVTPPQNQPKPEVKPAPAPEVKNDEKKDEPKVEEKKTEEKKEDKPAQGGGLKPVVGQGQNAHDKKDEKK